GMRGGGECCPRPGAADKEDEALVVVEGLSETAKGSLVGRGRVVRVGVGGRAERSAAQPEAPVHGAAFRGKNKDNVPRRRQSAANRRDLRVVRPMAGRGPAWARGV